MVRALLLVALLLWGSAAAEESVPRARLAAGTQRVDLARDVGFYTDATAAMGAEEVAALAASGAMKRVAIAHIPMFRIDHGEAFWIRYDVRADASAPRDWMMELGRPNVARVQLFALAPDGRWKSYPEVGSGVPFSARPVAHRQFVFPVAIEPGATATFLVRVQYAGPATPQAVLWQPEALRERDTELFGLLCLYFGLAAGMVLYNLLLYVSVRDVGYLLYAGCVLCTAGAFAASSGLGAQFAWGEFTWWSSHCMAALYCGAMLFSALLTRQFLRLWEKLPRLDRLLRMLAWLCAAGVVASLVLPTNISAMVAVPAGIAMVALVPGVSIFGAFRRWPGASFFAAGWSTLYIGVGFVIARTFSLFPDNLLTENSLALSSAFEMILLSLALADRINEEKRQTVLLSERLEQHVAERTRELRETQQQLVATARRAGMAEIATNVLHNVGNTLNSVNVAAQLISSRLAQNRSAALSRAAGLLDEHRADLAAFLQNDTRGSNFSRYLRGLADTLQADRAELQDHVNRLVASVDHIKGVVATQQAYAGVSVLTERVDPGELVEDALRIAGVSAPGFPAEVVREVADVPAVHLDKTRALQILVNLLDNAHQALHAGGDSTAAKVTVKVDRGEAMLRFSVTDTGCGIERGDLTRIFSHGYTTREGGHGFGLHSCALAAQEMGGTLTAESDGPGTGATFTLELPLQPA